MKNCVEGYNTSKSTSIIFLWENGGLNSPSDPNRDWTPKNTIVRSFSYTSAGKPIEERSTMLIKLLAPPLQMRNMYSSLNLGRARRMTKSAWVSPAWNISGIQRSIWCGLVVLLDSSLQPQCWPEATLNTSLYSQFSAMEDDSRWRCTFDQPVHASWASGYGPQ